MRTESEILKEINSAEDDLFWHYKEILLLFLGYDTAKEFIREGITKQEWDESLRVANSRDSIINKMRDYMEFALDKAQNHRGLSSDRSVSHMQAWLWLLGDQELLDFSKGNHYAKYGVPILRKISEKYGFDIPVGESWFENMSNGLKCKAGCQDGC